MTDMTFPVAEVQSQHVNLRVGSPYANLLVHQQRFVQALGQHFRVDPACIIPAVGATGAIEAVRNHIFKTSRRHTPVVYMLSPEYWRARESFLGLGFQVRESSTQRRDFFIDEQIIVREVEDAAPDLLYFSLPNNPTGATFSAEEIIKHTPEWTAVIIDLTLPGAELDPQVILPELHHRFAERSNLFLVGSLSKSHGAAEHRIGWAICSSPQEAEALREENRNVISTFAIQKGIQCLSQKSPVLEQIRSSFAILREGERHGRYEIVRPPRWVESGYVLIRSAIPPIELQKMLQKEKIAVMWGAELGLSEAYVRLETLEPANINIFVNALNGTGGAL